ncbi:MAG TPA: tetratricopeptide repeat protein [Caulobacteraceae bacterium]|jgi:Flp pilus assembly protein TadD|nr:tetratricopeptide repeat protein [Caulobacteraceae bacterium]
MASRRNLLFRSALLGASASLVLAFGASAQSIDDVRPKIAPSVDTPSLYGTFLGGEISMQRDGGEDGARMLIGAATERPDDPILREHAFAAALLIGDVQAAARLAPDDTDPVMAYRGLGAVTRAVEALAEDKGGDAEKIVTAAPATIPDHVALMLLKPYAQAQAGHWDLATATHLGGPNERLVALLDQISRAQLLELRGRYAEADALYKTLADDSITAGLFAQPYGEFLERRGRDREAVAIYEKGLATTPGDPELIADRERAKGGGSNLPPAPSIKRGAADVLTYAAGAAAAERQEQLSLFYARLALRLDPINGQAWLYCGDALSAGKDEIAARACWSHVPTNSRAYAEARTRTAYSLQISGDLDGALGIARSMAHGDPLHRLEGQLLLAELLRTSNRYSEADQALDEVIGLGGSDWRVYYMRAAVREQLGRWPEAEADLKSALKFAPNEPELLNFLGYQWIDRGEDLKGGLALIERAVKARPNSGAMLDSLGWAHYRLGDYPEAVTELERAVLIEPSDPEINDHLGDAYWSVGRKDEAAYQWRRVLTFAPDEKVKARVETKLKDGLVPNAKVAAGDSGR